MKVLQRKAASPIRAQVEQPKPEALAYTFPAPVRGLVLNENIATTGPASAQILDNWVCTPAGIRVRAGSQKYATLPGPVVGLMVYRSAIAGKMFAATSSAIYDVSTTPNPDGAVEVVTGLTGSDYSSTMFGTAGGNFLIVANGMDSPRIYDGATWGVATTTGVTGSALSHVWSFASRLFFVERGTMTAHYLGVDQIGGTVSQFSLAGTFKLGGSLLFGATWSMDAGDGMDDKCVFVSTEGEVAVFQGTDPSDAAAWSLAGVYQITKPLGRNAVMRAGGDLLIATQSGLVPLSQAVQKDPAALSLAAISARIEPLWVQYAGIYDLPWHIAKWPEKGIMLVSFAASASDDITLCCNLQTGGWSRWTNIGIRCLEHFDGYAFGGGNDGLVKRLETGGNDNGRLYSAVYVGAHEPLGAPGVQKTAIQSRSLFRTSHDINPQVRAQTDYVIDLPPPPAAAGFTTVGVWDVSNWDEAVWDGGGSATALTSYWRAIGRTGYSIAPELQLSFGGLPPPVVELVSIDMTYSAGALVA